jgi:hypothetical protein
VDGAVPAGNLALVGNQLGPVAGSGGGLPVLADVLTGLPVNSLPAVGQVLSGIPLNSLPVVSRLLLALPV